MEKACNYAVARGVGQAEVDKDLKTVAIPEFIQRAVHVALAETCQDVMRWAGTERVRTMLTAELRTYFGWASNIDRAQAFHKAMDIPGSHWDQYLCRVVSTSLGEALIGIRFRAGKEGDVFVQVYARDFRVSEADDLSDFVLRCLEEFAVFAPLAVRVRVPPDAGLNGVVEHVDFDTFAGSLSEIAVSPQLPTRDVTVLRAENIDWFSAYQSGYADFHREHPDLVGVVEPEDKDDLAEALLRGSIFEIRVDAVWAGIFLVERRCREGLRGFVVHDELLSSEFRGERLAPLAQRALARLLLGSRREVLFGSVSPQNAPSRATALRVGRKVVSKCTFLKPL